MAELHATLAQQLFEDGMGPGIRWRGKKGRKRRVARRQLQEATAQLGEMVGQQRAVAEEAQRMDAARQEEQAAVDD